MDGFWMKQAKWSFSYSAKMMRIGIRFLKFTNLWGWKCAARSIWLSLGFMVMGLKDLWRAIKHA